MTRMNCTQRINTILRDYKNAVKYVRILQKRVSAFEDDGAVDNMNIHESDLSQAVACANASLCDLYDFERNFIGAIENKDNEY